MMSSQKSGHSGNAFSEIAVWQIMGFAFLLTFVWANERLDFAARIFGEAPAPFNFYRFCLLAAAIITAAIVTVGHTYEKQRTLVKHLLTACMYCHRVKTYTGEWQHVEEYFIQTFPIAMARGACPACKEMLESISDKDNSQERTP